MITNPEDWLKKNAKDNDCHMGNLQDSLWTSNVIDYLKKYLIDQIPVILQEFKNKAEVDYTITGINPYTERQEIEVYFIEKSVDKIAEELIQQFENQ